jgi:hypothetical protein
VSPLPTDFTPSVISSVDTDGQNPSVYTNEITNGMLRILKKRAVRWRGGYCGYFFTDRITKGFKTPAPYSDVTDSPMQMPMESPTDSKQQHRTVTCPVCRHSSRQNHRRNSPSVKPSLKVNISLLTRPYPPLFLILLPHLNSPQLQTTSAPPQKKISLFSAQQVIYLEVFLSQHPCSDLPTDFYQFLLVILSF